MTQLVGIVNVTPDSFSDGGKFFAPQNAICQAEKLFAEGAALVDIGAESTRPGATPLTDKEEWSRLKPVLTSLIPEYPDRISVDSYHPYTIAEALSIGQVVVNDITGLKNEKMADLVVAHGVPVIISHLPAPDAATAHSQTPIDSAEQVRDDLLATAEGLIGRGVAGQDIILDPGIGFGKTERLNWELLRFARLVPEYSVMIGHSRKRFLGEERMGIAANLAAAVVAIESGAKYLRVHDVAAHARLSGVISTVTRELGNGGKTKLRGKTATCS